MSNEPVFVSLQFTANPNTLKYAVNRVLSPSRTIRFTSRSDAEKGSVLAAKLFGVPGIAEVLIGRTFVTVTKTEAGDWDQVHQKSSAIIEEVLSEGSPVLNEAALEQIASQPTASDASVVEKILQIIDQEIRPGLQMDGGDIRFEKFENGIVYVELQGACQGCPGAAMTLKMGVEARLRDAIPEVQEVIPI